MNLKTSGGTTTDICFAVPGNMAFMWHFFDAELIKFLMTNPEGELGKYFAASNLHDDLGSVSYEVSGRWLLCITFQIDSKMMFGFHDWAQSVRQHMPDELTSRYPIT